MKKYISFFKIRFGNALQYRVAAYAGVATQFAWGGMEILMFSAFYKSNPNNFPMEFSQLTSYLWLQQAFLALFMTWYAENDITSTITSGNIAYELSRPVDLYNMWFTRSMASRLAKAVLRCMPILIVAVLLPKPYCLSLPNNYYSAIMFLISAVLAFLIVVSFCMLIYIATFFTVSPLGITIVATTLAEFLSGSIIPLPFLPAKLLAIVELLPFASMQNMPFRIYVGSISGTQIIYSILLQLFWLISFTLIGKIAMAKSLKYIVVQGG